MRFAVKCSTLKNAGAGLFAKEDIPAGTYIFRYIGCKVDTDVSKMPSYPNGYLMQIGTSLFDARDPDGLLQLNNGKTVNVHTWTTKDWDALEDSGQYGVAWTGEHANLSRFVNHGNTREMRNCKFSKRSGFSGMWTVATRDIKKEDELFTSYGKDFFSMQTADGNMDICAACGQGGGLLCCDFCPAAYHAACAKNASDAKSKKWACEACSACYRRRGKRHGSPRWRNDRRWKHVTWSEGDTEHKQKHPLEPLEKTHASFKKMQSSGELELEDGVHCFVLNVSTDGIRSMLELLKRAIQATDVESIDRGNVGRGPKVDYLLPQTACAMLKQKSKTFAEIDAFVNKKLLKHQLFKGVKFANWHLLRSECKCGHQKWHQDNDSLWSMSGKSALCPKYWTVMIPLNDLEKMGGTEFKDAGIFRFLQGCVAFRGDVLHRGTNNSSTDTRWALFCVLCSRGRDPNLMI